MKMKNNNFKEISEKEEDLSEKVDYDFTSTEELLSSVEFLLRQYQDEKQRNSQRG